MQVYEEQDFVMIPLAMNAFFYNIPVGTDKIRYSNSVSIGEKFLAILVQYFDKVDEGKYIILDLQDTDYAFHLFQKLKTITRPILFLNIISETLHDKIKEDLPTIQFSAEQRYAVLNISFDDTIKEICEKYSSSVISHNIYVKIVRNLIDDIPQNPVEPQKLDSSGLYSNMYVNVKRLFKYPENYYSIAFGLAKKIVDSKIEYDGLISSSKNGAILANLLGMLLNKKVIHIIGLGPKYSMNTGNLQKEIKKRKNYIYVFDFRCTGTEMKALLALISANEAYVTGATGIAVYKSDQIDIVNNNLMYLVDLKTENIPYKIAGEKEDIITLMSKQQ